MINLHWTVDHSSHTAPPWDYVAEFSDPLANALASPPLDPSTTTKFHRYTILPNFWSGFNRDGKYPDLTIGSLSIERERFDSYWQYHIEHVNVASGEHLTLDFTCEDELLRPLRSPWRIQTRNSADGTYDAIEWSGSLAGPSVTLSTARGLSIAAGTIPDPTRLTGLWAFVDILPALKNDSLDELTVLDDLEILKFNCCVRPLESWTLETGDAQHTLLGYSLFGEGLPPCYWWVTESGDVVAVSTILATFVLTERGHGDG